MNEQSNKINDGGPAFPQDIAGRRSDNPWMTGMSLRDWFAGQLAAAWLSTFINQACGHPAVDSGTPASEKMKQFAERAYTLADALIAEREKTKP